MAESHKHLKAFASHAHVNPVTLQILIDFIIPFTMFHFKTIRPTVNINGVVPNVF